MMMLSFGLSGQPQPQGGNRPAPPQMKSPEELARAKSDMMKSEVGLSEKQYKKVYKLFKKDFEYRQNQAKNAFGGGMPPMGGGPGMGGPGGGMPPMGGSGMGNPGGGMPGGQGMGDAPQGPRPEGMPDGKRPDVDIVSDEYIEKQEQKLKKILNAEQFSQWMKNHPDKSLEMPDLMKE